VRDAVPWISSQLSGVSVSLEGPPFASLPKATQGRVMKVARGECALEGDDLRVEKPRALVEPRPPARLGQGRSPERYL
jgi:hypothetical protein